MSDTTIKSPLETASKEQADLFSYDNASHVLSNDSFCRGAAWAESLENAPLEPTKAQSVASNAINQFLIENNIHAEEAVQVLYLSLWMARCAVKRNAQLKLEREQRIAKFEGKTQ